MLKLSETHTGMLVDSYIFVSRVGVVVSDDGWCDADWPLGCDVLVS